MRPCTPLFLFVDKRTLASWLTWVPPRFVNDSSIAAQFQRALRENFAVALCQSKKLALSSKPHRVGCPLCSERSLYSRVGSIERCVDVLTRARIVDMQSLVVESQGHVGM